MTKNIFDVMSNNSLSFAQDEVEAGEKLTLESYVRFKQSMRGVIMGKHKAAIKNQCMLENTVYTVVYIHNKVASVPTAVDIDVLTQKIKENMRASFEIEGHSVSDTQWKKISNSDKYLRLDYI